MNQIGFAPKLADYFQTLIGLKSYMGTIQAMNLALPWDAEGYHVLDAVLTLSTDPYSLSYTIGVLHKNFL